MRAVAGIALFWMLVVSSSAQSIVEYPLPAATDLAGNVCVVPAGATQNPKLSNLALQRLIAADGFLWFTNAPDNSIGRMDSFGNVTKYPIKSRNAGPVGCAFALSNGLLYFAEQSTIPAKVAMLDPTSDPGKPIIWELPIPSPNGGVAGVTFDANGILNIMIAKDSAIQRMKANGTFLAPVRLPPGRWPHGPVLCGGKIVFAENGANRFASLSPAGVVVERVLPQASSKPFAFSCGSDGMAYGTENGVGKIAQVDTATTTLLQEFSIPSGRKSAPMGIATGLDGNTYFANSQSNTIGKLTLDSHGAIISETPIASAGALPNKITPCFMTAVCFSNRGINEIGVLR